MQGWIALILAILLENCGTICLKLSAGFTKLWPSVFLFVFFASSLALFTFAAKTIEISTAYAVWSGLGTAFISLFGIFFFKETVTFWKLAFIVLIIVGAVGLNLVDRPPR